MSWRERLARWLMPSVVADVKLPHSEEVGSFQMLPCSSGDVLVMRYPSTLRPDIRNRLRADLTACLPDGVGVLVLDGGGDLCVLRTDKTELDLRTCEHKA